MLKIHHTTLYLCSIGRFRAHLFLAGLAAGAVGFGEPSLVANQDELKPLGIVLTWQQDPTTTMTVDWHVPEAETDIHSELHYKEQGAGEWTTVESDRHDYPYSTEGDSQEADFVYPELHVGERSIRRKELTGLAPDTTYLVRLDGFEREYRFNTMPETLDKPLRVAVGGDLRGRRIPDAFMRMNRTVMKYDPDFIVWGGDLPYADADPQQVSRWFTFFSEMRDTLIAEDGRVVPVVAGIGNHEVFSAGRRELDPGFVRDEWNLEDGDAPFYFAFFAFPGRPGYGVLDFGDYLSFVMLDSGHYVPIRQGERAQWREESPEPGDQTEWLAGVLAERTNVPHVFPVYHRSAYTTARNFDSSPLRNIREFWHPLFDRYGIEVVFENHDHTYKRTHPIRDGVVHPGGIVYLGDGAWGVGIRQPYDADETWYLKRSQRARHAIIMTLHGTHRHFLMVGEDGEIIDEYPSTPEAVTPSSAIPDPVRALGLENVSENKPVEASSDREVYPAANAVNGVIDNQNRWLTESGSAAPQWLEINLEGSYELVMAIAHTGTDVWSHSVGNYRYQFWDDEQDRWVDLPGGSVGELGGIRSVITTEFEERAVTDRVRWISEDPDTLRIREIQVFGNPANP